MTRTIINSLIRDGLADASVATEIAEARTTARASLLAGKGKKVVRGRVNGIDFQTDAEGSLSTEEWYRFLDLVHYQIQLGYTLPSTSTVRF